MTSNRSASLWRSTQRLTVVLMSAWLVLVVVVPWFAKDLEAWRLFGLPVGFWLVGQGMLLGFLAIVAVYVLAMNRLELSHGMHDRAGGPPPYSEGR